MVEKALNVVGFIGIEGRSTSWKLHYQFAVLFVARIDTPPLQLVALAFLPCGFVLVRVPTRSGDSLPRHIVGPVLAEDRRGI